jgi:hypothetical protein
MSTEKLMLAVSWEIFEKLCLKAHITCHVKGSGSNDRAMPLCHTRAHNKCTTSAKPHDINLKLQNLRHPRTRNGLGNLLLRQSILRQASRLNPPVASLIYNWIQARCHDQEEEQPLQPSNSVKCVAASTESSGCRRRSAATSSNMSPSSPKMGQQRGVAAEGPRQPQST